MHEITKQNEAYLGLDGYTLKWGTHIAGFYDNYTERDEIIFPFLAKGFDSKDYQLFSPDEKDMEYFKTDFEKTYHEYREFLHDKDYLIIKSAQEFYAPDGFFDPENMIAKLERAYKKTQKNGARNVRAGADMLWAAECLQGKEQLMAYEALLNSFVEDKPWISICLYNINEFSGAEIMNVLQTHPYTIHEGKIIENPYFIDPQEWLRENAPEYL